MATINDIVNADRYVGNPISGGRFSQGVTIDPSPLSRLQTFTFYANRDKWEKQNKQDLLAAQQIADIAAYDTSSPFQQYTDDLTKDVNQLQADLLKDPTMLTYDRDHPEKWITLQSRIGRIYNKRKHATTNDVLYNKAKAAVELIADPATKRLAQEELKVLADDLFVDGIDAAYNKQFESVPEPKPQDSIIPIVDSTTRSIIVPMANENVNVEITYHPPDEIMAKSVLAATGEIKPDITTEDWYKKLSPARQDIELRRSKLLSPELAKYNKTSADINSLMDEFKLANPNMDLNTVDVKLLPNNSIGNQIRSVRAINDQIDELNTYVLEGKIADPTGKVRTIPYEKFNINNGLSAAELIAVKSIDNLKVPLIRKVQKTTQQTNNSIEWARYGLSKAVFDKSNTDDLLGGTSVINEVIDVINSGVPTTVQNYLTTGKTKTVLEIADPNLLKEFATIDKDGKTTKTPDVVQFNKDTNMLHLVYFDSKLTKSGKRNINESIPMTPSEWLGQIVRRKYPNKDIGGINTIVDAIYTAHGRSLFNLSQRITTTKTNNSQPATGTTTTASGLPVYNQP